MVGVKVVGVGEGPCRGKLALPASGQMLVNSMHHGGVQRARERVLLNVTDAVGCCIMVRLLERSREGTQLQSTHVSGSNCGVHFGGLRRWPGQVIGTRGQRVLACRVKFRGGLQYLGVNSGNCGSCSVDHQRQQAWATAWPRGGSAYHKMWSVSSSPVGDGQAQLVVW